MWSKMGTENASRSTFWLQCHRQNFWFMQLLSRAPVEIFGKYIKDMPVYLNLPNSFPYFFKISLTWFGTFCVCRLPSLLKSQKVTFFSEIPTSQLLIMDLMAVHTSSDTKPGLQLLQCARTRKSQHCFHSSVSEGQFVTFRIVSYKISLKCQSVDKDRNYTWNISGKKIGDPTIASLFNFFFMTSQRIPL